MLAVYVELRIGALGTLALYLVAGFSGLAAELWRMASYTTPLLGASANIAGISGAFTALFWSYRVRVFSSFLFVYNRTFEVPVALFFPVLVLGSDIVGVLSPNRDSVAYIAHVTGFALGLIIGLIIKKVDGLPDGFLSREEYSRFQKTDSLKMELRLPNFISLLKLNPKTLGFTIEF